MLLHAHDGLGLDPRRVNQIADSPQEATRGARRYHCARSRNCRHLDCASSRQARAVGCADRPGRGRGGNLLRQHRHHRRQHHLPAGVSRPIGRRCFASRSSARRRPIIICHFCRRWRLGCWRSAPRRSRRDCSKPRNSCGRCSRARSPSMTRWSPRPAPSAIIRRNGWLKLYRGDRSFAGAARELEMAVQPRHRQCPARRRGGARARTFAGAGVPPRGALDRGREREQSAGADAGLRGALCRARRDYAQRRRPFAASGRTALARGHGLGPGRCRRRCRRARAVGAGSACTARHQAAACRQARLSPPFSCARQCRAEPADPRCAKTAIASRPWSRAFA